MKTTASSRATATLLILVLGFGPSSAYALRQERAGAEEIAAELQQPSRVGLEEGTAPSVALGELRRALQGYPEDSPATMQFHGLPGGLQRRVFDSQKSALSEAYKRLTWLPTVARVQVLKRRGDDVVLVTLGSPLVYRTYPGNRSPNYMKTALMYLRFDPHNSNFLDDASVIEVSVGALRRGIDLSVEQIYDLFGIQEGEMLAKEPSFLLGHGASIMGAIARTVEARDALVNVDAVPVFQPITVDDVAQHFRDLRRGAAWIRDHRSTIRAYIARALKLSGLSVETMEPRAAVRQSDLVQPVRVFYHRDMPPPRIAPGIAAVPFSVDPSQGAAELTAAGMTAGDLILLPDTIAPGTEHRWRAPGIETPILVFPVTGIADLTDQDLAALMAVAKNLQGQILRITPQTWSTRIINDQYFSIQY